MSGAALVARKGSINWWCLPEFHSPSVFARILDPDAGHFLISPVDGFISTQRYIPDTNVLETTVKTADGEFKLTDTFVVMHEEDKLKSIFAEH